MQSCSLEIWFGPRHAFLSAAATEPVRWSGPACCRICELPYVAAVEVAAVVVDVVAAAAVVVVDAADAVVVAAVVVVVGVVAAAAAVVQWPRRGLAAAGETLPEESAGSTGYRVKVVGPTGERAT